LIKTRNLSKKYGDLTVLKDITTDIQKGEVIAVIGPSGCGKSTFLRCLNLLETPSGGSIYIKDIPLMDSSTNIAKVRQYIGMVFQSFNLYAHLNVLDNLTIGPIKLLGISRSEAQASAMDLLRLVGLAEKVHNFPDELSGGQKQRVAIARCLAMKTEILLFDEPTSALDPTMVSEVLAVIRRLAREGMTMVIVTHEMELARNIPDRVFYLDDGIIYEEGTPQQIFEYPQKEKTRAFINRIRSFTYHITSREYDLYAMNAEFETFCDKHMLSARSCNYIISLAEEVLALQPDFSDINLSLNYTEKDGSLLFICESSGEKTNVLEDGKQEDDIGIILIKSRCESVDYKYEHGKNILTLKVKGEPRGKNLNVDAC
jgi:polar amino acid transport system ATP-binding protein